ncbi:hypothetical protein V3481_017063 [Fusarium oxysporum f. sp. vasinfectum]
MVLRGVHLGIARVREFILVFCKVLSLGFSIRLPAQSTTPLCARPKVDNWTDKVAEVQTGQDGGDYDVWEAIGYRDHNDDGDDMIWRSSDKGNEMEQCGRNLVEDHPGKYKSRQPDPRGLWEARFPALEYYLQRVIVFFFAPVVRGKASVSKV